MLFFSHELILLCMAKDHVVRDEIFIYIYIINRPVTKEGLLIGEQHTRVC